MEQGTQFETYNIQWPYYRHCHFCVWCGFAFIKGEYSNSSPFAKTREHIIPKSFTFGEENRSISAAHKICNNTRRSDTEWVIYQDNESFSSMPKRQEKWVSKVTGFYRNDVKYLDRIGRNGTKGKKSRNRRNRRIKELDITKGKVD